MNIKRYNEIRDMHRPSPLRKEEEERDIVALRSGRSSVDPVDYTIARGVPTSVPTATDIISEKDVEGMKKAWGEKMENRRKKIQQKKLNKEAREKGAEQVQTAIDKGLISTKKDPLKL